MKLAAIGDRVWFQMMDDRAVYAGDETHALLYDQEGAYWPKCSALVGPYVQGARAVHPDRAARKWFGDRYELRAGHMTLPARRLALWKPLGSVRRIFYSRRGVGGQKPAGAKQHPFNQSGGFDLSGAKSPVMLYVRGLFLRLELPRWCVVDGRGFARP